MKVICIFSGIDRRKLESQVGEGRWPDNWFYGFCQVKQHSRIEAEYLQTTKETFKSNLKLFLSQYHKLKQADVIFIASSLHFPLVLAKKFGFLRKQKWIFLNLDLTTKLKLSKRLMKAIWLADKIISPSQVQNDYLVSLGIDEHKLTFVPFGVDLNFYRPLPAAEKGFVFAVGRDPGRDYGTLVRAVKDSPERRVVIMGRERNMKGVPGPLPPNVEVVAEKTPEETRNYYERCLVSVVPGFGSERSAGSDCSGQTVILESLAYGRPVIASYKPWLKEYFEDGKHLLLVEPENAEALKEAIEKIYTEPRLRERLVAEGRKLVAEKFSSEKMGKAMARIILEAV